MKQFTCYGYISLSHKLTGVLYPLYRVGQSNVAFVQEIDAVGDICSFIDFYDTDQFHFVPASEITRVVGDASLYAFFDGSGHLHQLDWGDIRNLASSFDVFAKEADLSLLTRVALSRIAGASKELQLEYVDAFTTSVGIKSRTRDIIKRGYARNADEYRRMWRAIEEAEAGLAPAPEVKYRFGRYETEELFQWLYDHNVNVEWEHALAAVMRRAVYDERLFELLERLCSSADFEFSAASVLEKRLLGRGMEAFFINPQGSFEGDFADAMAEAVSDGSLLSFTDVVDPEVVTEFMDWVAHLGKSSISIVDLFLHELESDTISADLAYTLIAHVMSTRDLYDYYPESSTFEGNRLDRLKLIIKRSGRLALIIDARSRQLINRFPKEPPELPNQSEWIHWGVVNQGRRLHAFRETRSNKR